MRITTRTGRAGKKYFSFDYDDPQTGKRIRLKKSDTPHFRSLKAAQEWANSQDAHHESLRQANLRRIAWETFASRMRLLLGAAT